MPNTIPYGLHRLSDVRDRLVTEVGVDTVSTRVTQAFNEYNRQADQLLDLFVFRTTEYKTVFRTSARARTQPISEDGRALPIKTGAKYDVGLPINMWGLAWGGNWITLQKMTVEHVNLTVQTLIQADQQRISDEVLISLFQATDYSFDDDEHGTLTVKPIANGDAQTYEIIAGSDASATDSHFQTNAATTLSNALVEALADDVREHPENGGTDSEVTIWIPTNLRASAVALTGFLGITDSNVALGASANRLVGSDGRSGPGELLGYVPSAKAFIREWKKLPNYNCVAMTNSGNKAIAMREDEVATLRGYKKVAERADHPFYEDQYMRRAGFGAYNRLGAAILQLNNAGAYAVPTGFTRGS